MCEVNHREAEGRGARDKGNRQQGAGKGGDGWNREGAKGVMKDEKMRSGAGAAQNSEC
jgi:hypothetical protein